MEKTNKGKMNWELLKIEFIRQRNCKTLKSFCEVKGLNYPYVKQIAAKQGWLKERKKWQSENQKSDSRTDSLDTAREMGDKILVSTLPALLNAWSELMDAANDKDVYRNSENQFSSIKFNRLMQSFELLINNIKACSFYLSPETRDKLNISYEQLELKKKRLNEDEGEIVDDNFINALETASKLVWDDREDGK